MGFCEIKNKSGDNLTLQGDHKRHPIPAPLSMNKEIIKIMLESLGPIYCHRALLSAKTPLPISQSPTSNHHNTILERREVFLILKLTKSRCYSSIKRFQLLLNHWQPKPISLETTEGKEENLTIPIAHPGETREAENKNSS